MNSLAEIRTTLEGQKAEMGICKVASHIFSSYVYGAPWISEKANYIDSFACKYWGPVPEDAKNNEEIIQRLQLRLDILRTL